MNIEQIIRRLPQEPGKPPLVSGVVFEREQELDSIRNEGRIVVLTDRVVTRKGGNGATGLDGVDMNNIRHAIRAALGDERGSGFVKSFVVRERRLYPAGQYDKI
jgi:hypothetical protein